MDCGYCREMTLEEEFNSLPIDGDIKKKLINKLKQLEEDKNQLKDYLSKCQMEMDNMRATIVRLAMMLPNYKE